MVKRASEGLVTGDFCTCKIYGVNGKRLKIFLANCNLLLKRSAKDATLKGTEINTG